MATAVDETKPPGGGRVTLEETATLAEAGKLTGRRRRIQLIDAGWSANGRYYSPQVLAEAAAAKVFPAGTPMYIDHPSASERVDRPERSVKDLAARLATDARFENGALVAEATVFGPWLPVINEVADHIGVSIRAAGRIEAGEAEGRQGLLVTEISEGISVDFVTTPAAGGKVLQLIESVQAEMAEARNVGAWIESRLHLALTREADDMYGNGRLTRDERKALSSAVGDALDAFVTALQDSAPALYERDLWDDPPIAADMAESTTPAPPAQPIQEGAPMSGSTGTGAPNGGPTEISEADRLRAENTKLKEDLAEAKLTAAQLGDNARELEETKKSLEESRREVLRLKANDAARDKALQTLASSTLPQVAHAEVVEAVTGDNVPLNDEGALDEAKLTERIRAAIEKERRYLAKFAESQGMGSVRGLGSSGDPNEMTEADLNAGLKDVFTRLGMDESAADLAAKGR
ncbi:hypothetical protein AB0C10_36405 [Microbispora amethystogenes]|uniref:hypothetical protein n=1 Tax=Microbispora amethystogenes TaxID=1427754 RepID=UPI0033FB852D